MRALEKDPARRFQSAEEFIAALENARRAPTRQIVLEPTPGEPWVDEEEPRSRWWVWLLVAAGAGRARRRRVLPVRRQPRRRPERRRPQRDRGRRHPARAAGSRSTSSTASPTASRATRSSPRTRRPARACARARRVTVTVSGGKGTVAVPAVEGQSAGRRAAGAARRRLQDERQGGVLGLGAGGRRHLHLAPGRDPGDQGPHRHAHRLAGLGGRRRAEASSASSATDAEAQLKAAGLTADVTEEETTQPAGNGDEAGPADGDERRQGRHGQAHRRQGATRGARRDDQPPDRGRGHRHPAEGRLQGAGAHASRSGERRPRQRPVAGRGHAPLLAARR